MIVDVEICGDIVILENKESGEQSNMQTPMPPLSKGDNEMAKVVTKEKESSPASMSHEEADIVRKAKVIPNRGRNWTTAHQKALLRVVQDEDCCFFEKQTNADKNSAWKLLIERLKASYPDLFGGWILERKVLGRRLAEIMRTHKDNEMEAIRGTGRGVGRLDEELIQLCEEVRERMDEADTRKGIKQTQRERAREEKERGGQILCEHQLRTGGQRQRTTSPTSQSPEEPSVGRGGKRRRSTGAQERVSLIKELRQSLSNTDRGRQYDRAMYEYNLRLKFHHRDPHFNTHPGSLDNFLSQRLATESDVTSIQFQSVASQYRDVEVESPNKELRARP